MQFFKALIAALLLQACFRWCSSSVIHFSNQVPDSEVEAICSGPEDPGNVYTLNYKQSDEVIVGIDKADSCPGSVTEPTKKFSFQLFLYDRDNKRCKKNCTVEAREDGLYIKNPKSGAWSLYDAYVPAKKVKYPELVN